MIFPRQNELKRNIGKMLGGVLHTPSQNKKQIFSRQIHVLKDIYIILLWWIKCFLKLFKVVIWKSLNQFFCSKIINFWSFGEKISEETHFIILWKISWLSGGYVEGVFQNQRICQFLNKRITSLNGLVLLLHSSIFEISFEEHFWMNYSFRNLTRKVKNKMYVKLLLGLSENLW